jgi:hypothetical protein
MRFDCGVKLVAMQTTVDTLFRDAFTLTLKLNEETGDFACTCKPTVNYLIERDVERTSVQWLRQIAYGWARRRNHGRVDRKAIRVDCNGGFKCGRSTLRGTFVAPELSDEEVAAANTRQQLVAKLKREGPITPNWTTFSFRRRSRKTTAATA